MRSLGVYVAVGAFALGSATAGWACTAHETHTASKPTVVAMDGKASQSTKITVPAPKAESDG